jgi:hypothetical protein
MDTVGYSETLLSMYQTTWRDILGDLDLKKVTQVTITLAMTDSAMPIAYNVFYISLPALLFPPLPPYVHIDFVIPPSWLWPKCN